MTSRAADYPARHLRLAAEGPGPAERLLDVLGRWASTAPDPAAATAAGLPALLPGLAGEPVQMLQEDAGTARPSPLSVPAARPDTAYHHPDLFRARVQQAAAGHSQDIMTVLRGLMTGTPGVRPRPRACRRTPPRTRSTGHHPPRTR